MQQETTSGKEGGPKVCKETVGGGKGNGEAIEANLEQKKDN